MRYKVALRKSEEGFSVSCPGLPGCWSQGATEQEALANIRVAIHEYLDAAAEIDSDAEMRETELSAPRLRDELRTIRERCQKLPVLDNRTPDQILGYGQCELPEKRS